MKIEVRLDPVAKPRMTRADKWKHRVVVDRYFDFKDALVGLCNLSQFRLGDVYRVEFYIAMPKSWSKVKKKEYEGKPHQDKPDLDNLLKALNDCLKDEDKAIWSIEATKIWWNEGKIVIYNK
jgi:Holliday junction resolvase RusA-like endonuclease